VYVPRAFVQPDDAAWRTIAAQPLAQLVVIDPAAGALVATPVPLVARGDALVGHLARPNPVWQHGGEALAIFTAADAYVSPRWYAAKAVDGRVVPTWNYTTVHVHGRLVAHDEEEWKLELVRLLTDRFEAAFEEPWSVDDAPAEHVRGLLRGIVGIELVDLRVEGKAKLSQNRDDADRAAIAAGLLARTDGERRLAEAMGAARDADGPGPRAGTGTGA